MTWHERDNISPIITQQPPEIQIHFLSYTSEKDRKNYAKAFPWWKGLVGSEYAQRLPKHTDEEVCFILNFDCNFLKFRLNKSGYWRKNSLEN